MSLIKKKDQLEVKKDLFGLIYGQPASGKTSAVLSAEKPLMFDLERGVQRVNPEWLCDTVQPQSYAEIIEVLENEDLSEYKTIIFDTLLSLNDFCMEEVLKENTNFVQKDGSPSLKAYGVAKTKFKKFVELLEKQNKTILFVAHSTEQKNQEEIEIRIDGSTSAIKEITKKLDFMGYISIVGKKRFLNLEPTSRYYAKPIHGVEKQIEIPQLEEGEANTFMQDFVVNPAIEYRKKRLFSQEEYNKILEEAKKIIAEKGKGEEAKKELRKLKKIGDSQKVIAELLK